MKEALHFHVVVTATLLANCLIKAKTT